MAGESASRFKDAAISLVVLPIEGLLKLMYDILFDGSIERFKSLFESWYSEIWPQTSARARARPGAAAVDMCQLHFDEHGYFYSTSVKDVKALLELKVVDFKPFEEAIAKGEYRACKGRARKVQFALHPDTYSHVWGCSHNEMTRRSSDMLSRWFNEKRLPHCNKAMGGLDPDI